LCRKDKIYNAKSELAVLQTVVSFFIPFYYLLADPTDVVLSNPNFSKLVCDDDLFSSIKFEITMNLKVFYLHFDCKIDVQVNNPIAK
jgi:hypothetical protein